MELPFFCCVLRQSYIIFLTVKTIAHCRRNHTSATPLLTLRYIKSAEFTVLVSSVHEIEDVCSSDILDTSLPSHPSGIASQRKIGR